MMLKKNDIIGALRAMGLESGDIVMVHSSFRSILPVDGGPKTVIDAFLEILTESGTLIMPTFYFDFCLGKTYDQRFTKSKDKMGILTEMVRTDSRAHRVLNPICGFAMIGGMAEELSSSSITSSYGKDSLFEKFHHLDGKILAIGVPYKHSFSFIHYVEQVVNCKYRFVKEFVGKVIDMSGNMSDATCDMGVRDLDMGVESCLEPMGKKLESIGVIKVGEMGNTHIRVANAIEFYEATKRMPHDNPELLRKIVKGGL